MLKKWVRFGVLVLSGIMLFYLTGCGDKSKPTNQGSDTGKAQSKVLLKFSYGLPAKGFQGMTYEHFAQAVREESKGSIEVQTYPAGSLVPDADILDAISKGNVDVGHFMVAYVSPTIKEITPLEIPGAYPGNKYYEFEKATHPIVEKIFAKYGLKYLGANDVDTMAFTAIKKAGKNIKSPADMKGLPIRTPGKWGGEAIKMWSGSPVTVPISDLSVAMDRGTVSVAYTGWVITDGFKLYETAPYVTFTDLQEMFQGLIMSDKAWKKLDAEQQAAVTRAAKRWMDYAHQLINDKKKGFEKTLKDSAGSPYHLTDAENKAFNEVTGPLMEMVKPIAGPEGEDLIKVLGTLRK